MSSEKDNNRDDFWDIDLLLPQKKKISPYSSSSKPDTTAVEITFEPKDIPPAEKNKEHKLNLPSETEKNRLIPEFEYEIKNGLISKVKVGKWSSQYSFYEGFRTDAAKLHSAKESEAGYIPFFSYTPQYKQLNRSQLEWYLWWRKNVRMGIYLHTDYSYLVLYIYEIINLPDLIPPREGIYLLCDVWLAYRNVFHRIDKYLAEWVCDYCLIHRIPLPKERLNPIIPEIIDKCTFKEFYMHFDESSSDTYAELLIQFASNYNWRNSKYATADNLPLFKKHIAGAIAFMLANDKENVALKSARSDSICRTYRDAFSGSLCAHNIKRRIEIYYYSFNRSYSLRLAVTNLVRYAENRLRARLGIKSRLAVSGISSEVKQIINHYFDIHFPSKKAVSPPSTEEQSYMRGYEAEHTELSSERALNIEKRSWETTHLLINSFAEEEGNDEAPATPSSTIQMRNDSKDYENGNKAIEPNTLTQAPPSGSPYKTFLATLNPLCTEFLHLVVFGSKGEAEQMARYNHQLPEKIADTINELAVDICGDILLEDEDGYSIIADYYEELKECLNTI
ncbi:MAG: hypothetical protein GX303_01465 [Clostridiales bacterium]|nr:hypothetical protein [Clostridiales bacterium]